MKKDELKLAEAAASLTPEDYGYLEDHGMLPAAEGPSIPDTPVAKAQETPDTPAAAQTRNRKGRRRRTLPHQWPEVGQVLQADYEGVHYEAELVKAPCFRSGRALRIITGPAAGKISHSPTGAMLEATAQQRAQQHLGKKGVANGWAFWRPKEDAHA
jgi:hypothetical protein